MGVRVAVTVGTKTGLLLLNLGTPEAPEPEAVGRYLTQFLMDKRVVDLPWLLRWFLVNVLIVPKRKIASAENYRMIWTDRGSPLLTHLEDLAVGVQDHLAGRFAIAIAMRYGEPSIENGLRTLAKQGVKEILVFPLYPQYAESTTLSSVEEVKAVAAQMRLDASLKFVPPFYEHREFIEASAEVAWPILLREKPEHALFSFHGLPERHLRRTDPTGRHCLKNENCCAQITESNRDCYRAQCFATARALAQALALKPEQWSVAFQSRLGRTPWIRPYTDEVLHQLGARGVKRLAVMTPSFTADCLETLEEIAERGCETFREAGGETYTVIPCPNSHPRWVEAVKRLVLEAHRVEQAK